MPFDSTGLTPKTREQLLLELNSEVVQNVKNFTGDQNVIVDTSDDSPIGRLNAIYANHFANLWEQAALIQQSMRADQATGVSLEKLAFLVGFVRTPATSTRGDLRFIGDHDTVVPAESIYASLQGDTFSNPSDVRITLNSCYSLNVLVGVLQANTRYSITIDAIEPYFIDSTGSSTMESILTGLRDLINADSQVTATYVPDVDFPDQSYLRLVKNDDNTTMSVVLSPVLISNSVEVQGTVVARQSGIIFGDAGTVNNILTSQSGLDSVNNPDDFTIGNIAETDSELRTRVRNDYNTVGSGTLDTIQAILDRNTNIRSSLIEENRTFQTLPVTSIPPKSYEVILNYDTLTNNEVAQLIWDAKPIGIATYGTDNGTAIDSDGGSQTVNFSIADDLYVYFRVRLSVLDATEGETFPTNYKELIQDSVTLEGNNNYLIGVDVIGKRFYGTIYNAVSGINELDVEVYLSTDSNLNPATIADGDWKDSWAVGRKEISSYATNRFLIEII